MCICLYVRVSVRMSVCKDKYACVLVCECVYMYVCSCLRIVVYVLMSVCGCV